VSLLRVYAVSERQPADPSPFLDPGPLTDGDLELVLVERMPGDPAVGRVPMYRFPIASPQGDAHPNRRASKRRIHRP